MSEYVNNSNANISNGIHAPVVNYQQIPIPHQPQPRPMTDPGGKFDIANTASTLLKGMDTAKKETNDRAKNEYALEVRRLTAAVQQGNLTSTSYETAVRAAGDRALASGLSSEDVATIESKHSFGYLSTAQKERDQRMKDSLEWDKKAAESFTQNSPMFSLNNDYEGANKTLAGFRASKQTADTFLQQYMSTGNESFKPYAVRGMSDLWVKNFNLTLGNMLAQGKEPTQGDIARIQSDITHKMVVAGYPKDFVDEAVGIAMNSSDLKMYADTEATTRTFTRKQLEDINKITLESTAAEVYQKYPEWAVFKSIDVEREVAVGVLKDIPIKEQDALYKNFQDLITNGAAISRYATQTKQGASLPYKIINNTISNPAAVTPATNVNLVKGSLDTILRDNAEAVAGKDPQQIETAGKNLSNISTKAVRSNLEKQLNSNDPNTVRQAQLALDALDGIEEAKLAVKLKTINNSPLKGLESSTANERMYVDPLTGDLKLRKATGLVAPIADAFYGKEFEQHVKDINTLLNEITGKDPERNVKFFNKYFGLDSNSNELVSKPLPTIDDSGLYRDGEEGEGRIGGYAGLGGMLQIDEERYARGKEAEAERKAEAQHQEYLDTFRDLTKPTIDVDSLPIYDNGDGTVSSMLTITIEEGNKQILIPTIRTEDGKRVDMSDEEAVEWYHKTGGHFGKYDTVKEAEAAAKRLSTQQGIKATATVSSSSPVGGASVSYKEPGQSLKYSDFSWSPEIEMFSDIIEDIESKGKQEAVSSKGAKGRMQLMPDTYKMVAKKYNLPADGIDDPELNKIAGTLFFQDLVNKYNDINKTLAAYNWGPGYVDEAVKEYGINWYAGAKKKGITWNGKKRYLPKETQNYLAQFHNKLENGAW